MNHPNIARTMELGGERAHPFIATEYPEGQSLYRLVQQAVAQSRRVPLSMHLRVLLELLSALECARDTRDAGPVGVVHGEINPHRVLITYDGRVKLIGFGVSETFSAIVEKGLDLTLAEKVRYMAPEQVVGGSVDVRADLFAVGVMLWEAIADRRPWADKSDAEVWQSLRVGAVPRVRDVWPYIDPSLGAIVDRSMSALPDQRYRSVLGLRRDLERYIETRHLRLPSARALGDFVAHLFAEDRAIERPPADARIRLATSTDLVSTSNSLILQNAEQPSVRALAVPRRLPHAWGRSRTMLPIAASAGVGAFIALAAVSATRLRAGEASPIAPSPTASIATVSRPSIPVISIDDLPRVPDTLAAPPSTPTLRWGTKPATHADHAPLPVAAETLDCQPPYTIDPQTGKKQWRLDCL